MIAYFLPFLKVFTGLQALLLTNITFPIVNASKAALNYFRIHITETIALEVQKT